MESQNKLTPSNSSSLLLTSANLSWTQPSGAVLVQPQPPIDPSLSSRSTPSFEVGLSSSSRTTPSPSVANLDNFQSIHLDNTCHVPYDPNNLPDYYSGFKQMSISDVSTNVTQTHVTFYNSSQQSYAFPSQQLPYSPPLESNIESEVENPQQSEASNTLYSHSQMSFGFSSSNMPLNAMSVQPPPLTTNVNQSPIEPPKVSAVNSFKRQGPLRLYDPSHGLTNVPTQSAPNQYSQNETSPNSIPFQSPLPNVNPPDGSAQLFYPTPIESNQTQSDTSLISPSNLQQYPNTPQTIEVNNQYNAYANVLDSNLVTEPQIMGQNYTSPEVNYANYIAVQSHWFYQKIVENKELWTPFSMYDSLNLEEVWRNNYEPPNCIVATDGGRYDVNVKERIRYALYWNETSTIVRRCTWFYKKDGHNRYSPYAEDFAAKLEEYYVDAVVYNRWNHRLEFPDREIVVMHNPHSIFHYQSDTSMSDEWGSVIENHVRPRTVHRGAHQIFDIEEGEPTQIDHLLFLVHGIGEFCDLRFRPIVEVVDDFRNIALSLSHSHFKPYLESGRAGRIEMLPISWHAALHGDETGIDTRLKLITLKSIPKLRNFSNDTILDALFYTSPLYCQTIVDTVGSEINRLYSLFKQRNPYFNGSVAIGGHSLGSLIVFDILAHQNDSVPKELYSSAVKNEFESINDITDIESVCQKIGIMEYLPNFHNEKVDLETLLLLTDGEIESIIAPLGPRRKLLNFLSHYRSEKSKSPIQSPTGVMSPEITRASSIASVTYNIGTMGTGHLSIQYPKLDFSPSAFFGMGSPIAMFLTVRGIETLSAEFKLPSCTSFFNIYHPYDPIAYRIEPLIDPSFLEVKPVLIPHHKGRKRMHLEIKESISRLGIDFKQKVVDSLRYTWNSINEFAKAHRTTQEDADDANRTVDEELRMREQNAYDESGSFEPRSIGSLNNGRRIDYVLQEKPIEIFNEYLFAMMSHTCYWDSEDTALLILKELYAPLGIYPQCGHSSSGVPKLYNPTLKHQISNVSNQTSECPQTTQTQLNLE